MRSISFISALFWSLGLFAQGWVQEGAHLQNDSGFIVIEGTNAHFSSAGSSTVNMKGNSEIRLQGNWINNGSTEVFTGNDGLVNFNGTTQNIQGSRITYFPSLETGGNGTKTLQINTLVGGMVGRGTGQLILSNGNELDLNSNRLIINNPATDAISNFVGMGYILGETGPIPGYGEIQWVIRDAATGSIYTIPLGTNLNFRYDVQSVGTQLGDTGSIIVSTYPTNSAPAINNRPLPTTVNNTDNEYAVENSISMTDRFWMLNSSGYTANPDLDLYFNHYLNNGGSNVINVPDLGAIRWNSVSDQWDYPVSGTSNVASSYVRLNAGTNFSGIWTLSDTTPCPVIDFLADEACLDDSTFFTNLSTTPKGSLDLFKWDFNNSRSSLSADAAELFTPVGSYPVKLSVRNSYGCWDSITKTIVINPRAIASFIFVPNNPIVLQPVQFTNQSQDDDNWLWNFGDGSSDVSENPNHSYDLPGDYTVELIANNIYDCPDTMQQQLTVELSASYWVPNAFSPNADLLNDGYGLTTLANITNYRLEIFNRWGERIFESNNFNNRWDGTYMGRKVHAGVYIYSLSFRDLENRSHRYNGDIHIVE
jgi:gliding motility-associated-like protein